MKRNVIICDIDGTIFNHSSFEERCNNCIVLPNVKQAFSKWIEKDYQIILITGRKKSERKKTKKLLSKNNIPYDKLIMGIGSGIRYIINDNKVNSLEPTACAFTIKRNEGFSDQIINI